MSAPQWLTIAQDEMGVEEIAGAEHNPRVMEYFATSGGTWVKSDETPWCGAFVGFCMATAGHPMPKEPLRARAWLAWGKPLEKPVHGCVVILKRGSNPQNGHVGFFMQKGKNGTIYVLGGNQRNRVSIEKFKAENVLGYRWAAEFAPLPKPTKSRIVESGTATSAQGAILSAGGIGAGVVSSGGPSPVTEAAPATIPSPPDVTPIVDWQYFATTLRDFAQFAAESWVWIAAAIGVYLILTGRLATWARQEDAETGKTWEEA